MGQENGFSVIPASTAPCTDDQILRNDRPISESRSPHAFQTLSTWDEVRLLSGSVRHVTINGKSLNIAEVVAVAKYGVDVCLSSDPKIQQQIEESIHTLNCHLTTGHLVVYGVTTGFGGSADTRTTDLTNLQRALVQHQESGILSRIDIGHEPVKPSNMNSEAQHNDFEAPFDVQSMPTAWVRASMLTRCNSIIRGHSAVRSVIAKNILSLLHHEITPIVPLRGSISASGDLSPLSYIAGALEGNSDIFVRRGKSAGNITTARQALTDVGLEPVVLRAKEGLGLLNGTAFSAATASLAIFQAQETAILSQVLTAMATEAVQGTAESFHPTIASMRPHPGQVECAANILSFLKGSKLAQGVVIFKDVAETELCQDRYALRTSPQWIGPQLEDLLHAEAQLVTELNSTTDNPLIDASESRILHGGNFQAAIVTSTMDRARLALDRLGRMLYSQAIELINPATNKGLPPNLCSDDPSLSFTCKGADINMAAYTSELSFLANPVGNHVVSAEMHNQSINSLALVSSRYTFQALTTMRMLCATYLFVVTQALDLRVLQIEFLKSVKPDVEALINSEFSPYLQSSPYAEGEFITFTKNIWSALTAAWSQTTTLDLSERALKTAESTIPTIANHFSRTPIGNCCCNIHGKETPNIDVQTITAFTATLAPLLESSYQSVRSKLYENHLSTTPPYLGAAAREIYLFIRSDSEQGGLGVKFHRGLIEHPTYPAWQIATEFETKEKRIIGSRISAIYESIGDGRLRQALSRILHVSLEVW